MADTRLVDIDQLLSILLKLPNNKDVWVVERGQPDVKPGMTVDAIIRERLRKIVFEADVDPKRPTPRWTTGDLLMLITELADLRNECQFDHHGYCQEHGHLRDTTCPHAKAKQILRDFGVSF